MAMLRHDSVSWPSPRIVFERTLYNRQQIFWWLNATKLAIGQLSKVHFVWLSKGLIPRKKCGKGEVAIGHTLTKVAYVL